MGDFAHFQHIAVVGGLERGAGVLLDQEDRHAEVAQRGDDTKISRTISGARPRLGSSSNQKPRLRHQRTAKRQHLPFAAGQRLRLLPTALGEAGKARINLLQALFHLGPIAAPGIRAEQADCRQPSNRRTARGFSGTRQKPRSTRSSTSRRAEIDAIDRSLGPGSAAVRSPPRASVVLPAPFGPITVTIWPALHRRCDAAHGLDLAVGDVQVLDREQRRHATPPR